MEPPTNPARVKPALVLDRQKLDELRRANGIATEAELARVIGVSPVTLWRISRGEVYPSNAFMARVVLAFPHVAMSTLFRLEQGDAA